MFYHITDECLTEKILREGLKANPVVYVATSYLDALSIRHCQLRNGERFGASTVFGLSGDYELLIDPHIKATPFGHVAFMVYEDISPDCIQLVYS